MKRRSDVDLPLQRRFGVNSLKLFYGFRCKFYVGIPHICFTKDTYLYLNKCLKSICKRVFTIDFTTKIRIITFGSSFFYFTYFSKLDFTTWNMIFCFFYIRFLRTGLVFLPFRNSLSCSSETRDLFEFSFFVQGH